MDDTLFLTLEGHPYGWPSILNSRGPSIWMSRVKNRVALIHMMSRHHNGVPSISI